MLGINRYKLGTNPSTTRVKGSLRWWSMDLREFTREHSSDVSDLLRRKIASEGLKFRYKDDNSFAKYLHGHDINWRAYERVRLNIIISEDKSRASLVEAEYGTNLTAMLIEAGKKEPERQDANILWDGKSEFRQMLNELFDDSMLPIEAVSLNEHGTLTLSYSNLATLNKTSLLSGIAAFGIINNIPSVEYRFLNKTLDYLETMLYRTRVKYLYNYVKFKDWVMSNKLFQK